MKASLFALTAALVFAVPAGAEKADRPAPIVVTGERLKDTAAATTITVTADDIFMRGNALSAEDALKYAPGLVIRKRHVGDLQAPIATRTSGLGASARSLIFADGVPLSALIANNNGNASPRWAMVSPDEIARIDVLYGPFSAEYAGNSIGTVVNITTRTPERFEARAGATTTVQRFDLYATHRTLPSWQFTGSVGGKVGPLALFASVTRTDAQSQPVTIVTATAAPAGTTGAFDGLSRTGAPVRILGAGGLEHHLQDAAKLKAVLDLGGVTASYVVGLFRDDTSSTAETYLGNSTGPVYTTAFSASIYTRDALHWSHALSLKGDGARLQWSVIGTLYDYARDVQRTPTAAPPLAFTGGAGTAVRQDGTGWVTLDAKAAARLGTHAFSFGGHLDRYRLENDRYTLSDWRSGADGALNQASRGKTRTLAVWAQDAWSPADRLTLTLGARYEWWRAYGGLNFSTAPALNVAQPELRAQGFSPKLALRWQADAHWSLRAAFGQAWRFPTVGELYQVIATGPTLTVPDPRLRPERARSAELALERRDEHGTLRLSLFSEAIRDALIAQSAPLVPGSTTLFNYVQNVERTRARGGELAWDRRDLVSGVDLSGSLTYVDAITAEDRAFPAAVGKRLPSVPRWKGTAVLTWRVDPAVSLTGAVRFASRNYATLDNSDVVGNTWQGFYRYAVVDLRAVFRPGAHFEFAVGIDNLANGRYFLFHPFPQRSFTAQARWRL